MTTDSFSHDGISSNVDKLIERCSMLFESGADPGFSLIAEEEETRIKDIMVIIYPWIRFVLVLLLPRPEFDCQ
jgi:hypothetical protein